ncbi:MAG TPA: DNA repair protein RecO [Vicinamibacterales bacterium]|jgi:DNA repair protein RecO (recombination protein O)|nr:DNA repair protein RecO [Vicinamibacterales bacterium]
MPVYTADALILRTYKLGEADRIVVFLTRDRGKKRGVAKGARRPRSRYIGALEPMTRAGVAYYEREQRDLVRLNYVEPVQSPLSAATAEALGHVGYFAELIDEWAPEAHADERLFRLGASMLGAVAAGGAVEPLARYFEYWLLRLQGVYPGLACSACGTLFDRRAGVVMPPREHVFVCGSCAPGTSGSRLSPEAVGFLLAAGRLGPEQLGRMPLTSGASQELETAHRRLISLHLEKELKSARVLREMRQAR